MKPPKASLAYLSSLIQSQPTPNAIGALLVLALLLLFAASAMADDEFPPSRPNEVTPTVIYRPIYLPSACDFGPAFTPRGASEARAASIDKNGPQLPAVFSMSAFSAMGFSKGNWPVVIDYSLERDSLLIAVIAPEGSEPIIFRLNAKKGRWQTRLAIPDQFGSELRVAQYVIRSLDDNIGRVNPVHLHIHGIAAGPKAVGSLGIDRVSFSPPLIRPARREKAQFAFHAISDFKNVEVEFVRLAVSKGQIIAARVGGKGMGSIAQNAQKNGEWDGKSDGGGKAAKNFPPEIRQWLQAPRGQHLVQVRAWFGAKDGG
ncbi:MAG TPA: hypothetical protein VGX03_19340, partial [Candidatus Binatia bacterium]|nr:hypothetical protein [Candidatus Binatia bacterium]